MLSRHPRLSQYHPSQCESRLAPPSHPRNRLNTCLDNDLRLNHPLKKVVKSLKKSSKVQKSPLKVAKSHPKVVESR
jgi:hypothetical protein